MHRIALGRTRTGVGSIVTGCLVVGLAAGVLQACSDTRSAAAEGGPAPAASVETAASADVPDVLATVAGEEIRMNDLAADARDQLAQMENLYRRQRQALLMGALDAAIADRLLAAEAEEQGTTVAALVASQTDPVLEPTDAEVEAWYQQNRSRLQGRSLDQLREQIREFLQQQQADAQNEAYQQQLREKYDVDIRLEPYRVSLDGEGHPAIGPADADVTLVEFSDFECPFCSRFFPTIKRLEEEYSDRVRIVYRQFPIPSLHPAAFKAAEASLCAHEQGEFWAYHDLLFQEQDRLAVRDLKEKAGRIGLDQGDFDECLDTGRFTERVQDDMALGRSVGVSGTPALFVNGIAIEGGAVAYDSVAKVLDEELARVGG